MGIYSRASEAVIYSTDTGCISANSRYFFNNAWTQVLATTILCSSLSPSAGLPLSHAARCVHVLHCPWCLVFLKAVYFSLIFWLLFSTRALANLVMSRQNATILYGRRRKDKEERLPVKNGNSWERFSPPHVVWWLWALAGKGTVPCNISFILMGW